MPYYSTTLIDMIGRLLRQRPGIDRSLARDYLNDRMRTVLDRRMWSGLIKDVLVSIPGRYTTGTISVNTGSPIVIGDGTNNWPVNDAVSTVANETINASGVIWVTPAQMQGITANTILFGDAAGTPEVLPVLGIKGNRVLLSFAYPHQGGFSLTSSSLAGQQLRVNGYTGPSFTVLAVQDPNTIILDNSWGAASLTGAGYQVQQMYVVLDPMLKSIISGFDPVQQIALRTNIPQEELNLSDPNRTSANSPIGVSPRGPGPTGLPSFEVYPAQNTPYQLQFRIHVQWPDMVLPSDAPPPFLNPNMLIYGALADAFRTPVPQGPDRKDLGFNLSTADRYEQMFQQSIMDATEADESLYQQMLRWEYGRTGAANMGAAWNVNHDIDAVLGNF